MNFTSFVNPVLNPMKIICASALCWQSVSALDVLYSENFDAFPANAIDTRSDETDMSQNGSSWRTADSSVQRDASVRLDVDGLLGPAGENHLLQFNIIDITWTTVHADVANLFANPTTAMGLSFDFYEPAGHNGDAYVFLTQNHAHIEKNYSWPVKITLNDGTLTVEGLTSRVFENAYEIGKRHAIAVFVNNSDSDKTYEWEGVERALGSEIIHLYLDGVLLVDDLIRNRRFIRNLDDNINQPMDAFTLQNAPAVEGQFPGQNIYYDNFVAYDLGGQLTFTYEGREADAPWRAEALAAIQQHRTAALAVQVQDTGSKVVEGVSVGYSLTRHGFDFSTLVSSNTFFGDNPNYDRYRRITEHFFNGASDAGGTRWPVWVGDLAWQNWSQETTIETYRWLKERGMTTRVLTTIYQGIHLPKFIRDKIGTAPASEIEADVNAHLEDIMGKLGPYVDEWEIINETAASRNLLDVLGEPIAIEWYQKAQELQPDAKLAINENSIVGGVSKWRSDFYFNQIKYLVDNGAPLHSIGMQGHHRTAEGLTPPADLGPIFDRFASFGIPIAITEYDLETVDNEVQADYTRDFLIGSLAHPAVESFLIFGFWAGDHWRPHAAMFNLDWSPKPQFFAYHDLVYGDWWTRVSGQSGSMGAFEAAGFHGDYRIMAMQDNRYGWRSLKIESAEHGAVEQPEVVRMHHTAVFPQSGNFGRILAKGDFSGADIVGAGRIGTVGYQGDGRVWNSFVHFPLGVNGLTVEAIDQASKLVFRTGAWAKISEGQSTPLGGTDVAVWAALQPAPASAGFADSFDFANLPGAARIATLQRESIRMLPDPDADRVVEPVLLDIEADLTAFIRDALATAGNTAGLVLTIGLVADDVPYWNPATSAYNVADPAYLPQRNVTFSLESSFVGIEVDADVLFEASPWINETERLTWMGRVDTSAQPLLHSDVLGWMWAADASTDAEFMFYDYPTETWAFTTAEAFPWIYYYSASNPGWHYLAVRFSDASWYFDPVAKWIRM